MRARVFVDGVVALGRFAAVVFVAASLPPSFVVAVPAPAGETADRPAPSPPAPRIPEKTAAPLPADLVVGDWVGTLDAGDEVLHLALHVRRGEKPPPPLTASIDSLDQGAMGIHVQTIGLVGEGLMLDITLIGARFDGTVSKDRIVGRWSQGGQTLPLTFTRGVAKVPVRAAEKPTPSDPIRPLWMGTLEMPGGKLRLVVHLARDDGGGLTGTIDSLDQGVNGIRVDSTLFKNGKLTLDLKTLGARFAGTSNKDATEISGQWTQGGPPLPLVLKPIDKVPE